MMRLSVERRLMICYLFLKHVRRRYGRKPILTDEARWYDEACRWLRLEHSVYPTEEKNLVERFIQKVKDGTECFDDSFPCRKEGVRQGARAELAQDVRPSQHLEMDLSRIVSFLYREV